MKKTTDRRHAKKNWITVLAFVLISAGVLAFAIPLVWQQIDYRIAAQKAAEAQAQMVIPDEDDYQPVDYAAMKKGITPTFSPQEMQEAANPPSFLEELGIVGDPSSLLFGIASAKAEPAEPASIQAALNAGAQALREGANAPMNVEQIIAALAKARKQVENSFFLLTMIQPITDVEQLSALSGQKVVDGITRGDKTITAARELMYASLTDLEELLQQVEVLSANVAGGAAGSGAESQLLAQMNMLSSYMAMLALHMPQDDFKAAIAQQRELAALAGLDPQTAEDENEYADIDIDPNGAKRTYLLEIPDIGVKVAAYRSGTFNKMYQNMRIGAAMFPRAPEPDTVANLCISAHRTGTRDYFRNLNKLSAGDVIYLHTSHLGSFKYEVDRVFIINNNDWSVTGDTSYPALTLLSCQAFDGISNAQRIVVRAKLVGASNGQ